MEESDRPVTPGQIKELVKRSLDLIPLNNLSFEKAEEMLSNQQLWNKVKAAYLSGLEISIFKDPSRVEPIVMQKNYIIDSVDGSKTIWKAKDIFKEGIDDKFKVPDINQRSEETLETPVAIFPFYKKSSFIEMFNPLEIDLAKVSLTQHQVINFCYKYPSWVKMHNQRTFFLIRVGRQFFVVSVIEVLQVFSRQLQAVLLYYTDKPYLLSGNIIVPRITL